MAYRDHNKYLAWRKKYNLTRRQKKIKLKCVQCSSSYETTEGFKNKSMFCSKKCKAKHYANTPKGKKVKLEITKRYYSKNREAILEKLRLRMSTDENYKLKKKKLFCEIFLLVLYFPIYGLPSIYSNWTNIYIIDDISY